MIRQITSASRHRSGYMAQHPGRANIPMSSGFDWGLSIYGEAQQYSKMENSGFEGPPNKEYFLDFIERFCFNTVRVDVAFSQL